MTDIELMLLKRGDLVCYRPFGDLHFERITIGIITAVQPSQYIDISWLENGSWYAESYPIKSAAVKNFYLCAKSET